MLLVYLFLGPIAFLLGLAFACAVLVYAEKWLEKQVKGRT